VLLSSGFRSKLFRFVKLSASYVPRDEHGKVCTRLCKLCVTVNRSVPVNPDQNVEYERCSSQLSTYFERQMAFGGQTSYVSVHGHSLSLLQTEVRAQVKSCVICGGQGANEAGFLQVFQFPLPLVPPIAPRL
jgi:hypothetical protein